MLEPRASKCLVVMYHYVRPRDPLLEGGVIGLTPGEFAAQLDELTAVLEPIDWPALWAWSEGRGTLPPRCVLLTFDDGLSDHAAYVLPALRERGLRGTFFVATDPLTRHRMLPAHAIHLLLGYVGAERLRIDVERHLDRRHPAFDHRAALNVDEAARVYHYETQARAELKYLLNMVLPAAMRREVVEALFSEHVGAHTRWSREWYLGWSDLVAMQGEGHTIGGHGHAHEPLALLPAAERGRDVQMCAAVLNEGLGVCLRPFSYPFGSFDFDVAATCRAAGFVHGFTTVARWLEPGCAAMQLPRIDAAAIEAELERPSTCTPGRRNS